jgi:glycosyltransferase involved in cell wall biosynthesis
METISIIIQKLSGGGAERVAANMSCELSKHYNVKLIVFDASDVTYRSGGELIDLALPPKKTSVGRILNTINRSLKIRKIKRENQVKCSISLLEGANLVNVFSRYEDRVIVSERNMASFFINRKTAYLRERFIIKKADKIVALSERVKQDLIDNFHADNDKVITIYNSVDYNKLVDNSSYMQNQVWSKFEKDSRYIVTMGRLTFQKGQWHLIKAFKYLTLCSSNVKLLILGEGELDTDLKKLVENLELSGDVDFLGFCPDPHSIIKQADIFAFSSIVEGLGNVLLEAMAFGLPIVSTDCDAGPREILAPQTDPQFKTGKIEAGEYGILVPTFNDEAFDCNDIEISDKEKKFGEALKMLISDDQLLSRYSEMSRRRVEDFTSYQITHKWQELIECELARDSFK